MPYQGEQLLTPAELSERGLLPASPTSPLGVVQRTNPGLPPYVQAAQARGHTGTRGERARQAGAAALRYGLPVAAGLATGGLGTLPALGIAGAAGAGSELGAEAIERSPLSPLSAIVSAALNVAGAGGGRVLGGMAGRALSNALDKTTETVAGAVNRIVPAFKGGTPQETIGNILGGRGQAALRAEYNATHNAILGKHADKGILVPSLERLPGGKTDMGVGAYTVKQAQTIMAAASRNLKTASRDPSRAALAAIKEARLAAAKEEFKTGLAKVLPPADMEALKSADRSYLRGKTIQRLFGSELRSQRPGAVGKMTAPKTGRLVPQELQQRFQAMEGDLRAALTPEEVTALKKALRISEKMPLARDVPGTRPGVGIGFSGRPHFGLPRQAQQTGHPLLMGVARGIGGGAGTAAAGPLRAASQPSIQPTVSQTAPTE